MVRQAITAEPLNGLSYKRLAQSLIPHEAIEWLERQIAQRPEFPDGPHWLEQMRVELGNSVTPARFDNTEPKIYRVEFGDLRGSEPGQGI